MFTRIFRGLATPFLLGVLAAACGGEPAGPTGPLPGKPAAGSRLRLEQWRHGSLELSYRFFDADLDVSCEVGTIDGTTACLPVHVVRPLLVAFADEACGSVAMLDSPGTAGAFTEGDLLTWRLADPEGVYRVGAVMADGPLYFSPERCAGGPASQIAAGPRRSLEPVPYEELVRFEIETVAATEAIEVDVLRGEDGSAAIGEPRLAGAVQGESGVVCQILDGRCVGVQWSEVFPFQRAFTDAECMSDAFFPQNECSPEVELVVAVDECGRRTPLGLTGTPSDASAYRRSPAGACVPNVPGGPGPGEMGGTGEFSSCLQTIEPLPEDMAPRFTQERTTEDGLTLVQTFAGEILVAAWFELPGGQRCDAARTADGEARCVPLSQVMQATSPGGSGGYVTVDVCAGQSPDNQPLYTFFSGTPCAASASLSSSDEVSLDELPQVARLDRFVPHAGPVYQIGWDGTSQTCTELANEGWFVTEEVPPGDLPALEHVVP